MFQVIDNFVCFGMLDRMGFKSDSRDDLECRGKGSLIVEKNQLLASKLILGILFSCEMPTSLHFLSNKLFLKNEMSAILALPAAGARAAVRGKR